MWLQCSQFASCTEEMPMGKKNKKKKTKKKKKKKNKKKIQKKKKQKIFCLVLILLLGLHDKNFGQIWIHTNIPLYNYKFITI